MIEFIGAFESLRKDREGEIKLTFTIPLSDEEKVRQIPIQKALKVTVEENEYD
jgi:hypothetical protein